MTFSRGESTGPAIEVEGVGKSFGDVTALKNVSCHIDRGEVVGLLGPNGAGKSTLVDILSTLTEPDTGWARVAGFDVVSHPADVRRSIMLTGQQVAVDTMLTGRQNLVMFARLQGLRKAAAQVRADELLAEFELGDAADRRVATYSGGMQRRIDIACGLVVRPDVVFLDEPTTGLDPRSRQSVWTMVRRFKKEGITTLLTTQYLDEADALSDRIILIDRGVVIAEGTPEELKERTGASFCEVVPLHPADVARVAALVQPLLPSHRGGAVVAVEHDRVIMPSPDGATTLLRVLTELAAFGVEVADVVLRRPSLDDVFLSLTGDGSAPGVNVLP